MSCPGQFRRSANSGSQRSARTFSRTSGAWPRIKSSTAYNASIRLSELVRLRQFCLGVNVEDSPPDMFHAGGFHGTLCCCGLALGHGKWLR